MTKNSAYDHGLGTGKEQSLYQKTNDINLNLTFKPLSPENWEDFVELLGKNGCGGCWCMSFRLKRADFLKQKGECNKQAMKELVEHQFTGLLAYYNDKAIGWLSMSPREQFTRIDNSRLVKRTDKVPAWSLPCLFILKQYRRLGVSTKLLEAAVDYAKKNNIKTLEAYPIIPYQDKMPDAFAWNGLLSAYQKVGFKIAAQSSPSKFLVRYDL